ncbi:MAG TPA: hypothetical protein DEP84_17430 [Chloroflexi bacterium]|nr:hypothetical protein [Chloroflexota bacterium]
MMSTSNRQRWFALGLMLLGLSTFFVLPLGAAPPADRIFLRRRTIDPRAPAVVSLDEEDARLWIVQFSGPIQAAWRAEVERAGAEPVGYLPDFAYLARMDAATAHRLRSLDPVRLVVPLSSEDKIAPALAAPAARGLQPAAPLEVAVVSFPDTDLAELGARLKALGGAVSAEARNRWEGRLEVRVPAAALDTIAGWDEVRSLEPLPRFALLNDRARATFLHVNQAWAATGLYGAGQIIAIADTGLDTGTPATLHPDLRQHLVRAHALGRAGDWSDPHGHGTHVSGSAVGDGRQSGSNPSAHEYTASFAGTAPEAALVVQSILDDNNALSGIPGDLGDLMRTAYADGARIHSDSWGGPTGGGRGLNGNYGGYTLESRQADEAAWELDDMLILFAAGNTGVDRNQDGVVDGDGILTPATAKNVLTVGATENDRPDITLSYGAQWGAWWPSLFPAEPLFSDHMADNSAGMAAFSSRGPTDDGRIKPDLVAPGTFILSTRSQISSGTGWGRYDEWYFYNGGTSMATPLVAGAAAVARQWLTVARGLAAPSAALLKAVLINGAMDTTPGQYGTGSAREIPPGHPNPVAGWGMVDLAGSMAPAALVVVQMVDDRTGVATGKQRHWRVTTTSPGPLRVTLAWTDVPAETIAAVALVNDLDLEVTAPDGTIFYGNGASNMVRDRRNVIEDVVIPVAAAGTYQVRVVGFNVPWGRAGAQPFALVLAGNGLAWAAPILTATPTATATPRPCPEDLNGNRRIDVADLQWVASRWLATPQSPSWDLRADLVPDGVIHTDDIAVVARRWNQACP